MSKPSAAIQALLDAVPEGYRAVMYMVPTRIIRVIVDSAEKTFRVEQLVGDTWHTLSTHTNQVPWGAFKTAVDEAYKAQHTLVTELKKRIASRNKLLPGLGGPGLAVPPQGIAMPQRRATYDVRMK